MGIDVGQRLGRYPTHRGKLGWRVGDSVSRGTVFTLGFFGMVMLFIVVECIGRGTYCGWF